MPPNLEFKASTTHMLTAEKPADSVSASCKNGTLLTLPEKQGRKGEGGLRLSGQFKKDTDERPLVTVITVVYNDSNHIEKTIQSVLEQTYRNVEYIVIDGASTDGTVEVVRRYEESIDYWVSEPDECLYEAMNKAIETASGTWLNFMNSGDTYADSECLASAMLHATAACDVIYSDHYRYTDDSPALERVVCDAQRLYLVHQSMIYRRQLHAIHGNYLVRKDITISDYLFFNLLDRNRFVKCPQPISKNLEGGISYGLSHIREKYAVDYLFNNRGLFRVVLSVLVARVLRLLPW